LVQLPCRRAGLALAIWLAITLTVTPVSFADAGLSLTTTGSHILVGNTGGAIDTYQFIVPQPISAPTVTVTFSPSTVGDGSQGGFNVYVDGLQVGSGTRTPTPGVLTYTLPQHPSGSAVVQVFSYSATPSSFTIQSTGVPAGTGNGPATGTSTAAQPVPLNGTLSGNLPAAPTGAFAYFGFPSPGSSPPSTVTLIYSPADAEVNQAVGFNVIDQYSNNIGNATQPAGQNLPSATLSLDLSRTPGEPLSIQVFNYAPGVKVTYQLSVSGIAPVTASPTPPATAAPPAGSSGAAPPAAFQPFWVENFQITALWSGAGAGAISFGNQPQFSSFLVVQRQSGSRLHVYNPRTRDYAYIDASAVGPSGPPAG
jgi:hypothetical protein